MSYFITKTSKDHRKMLKILAIAKYLSPILLLINSNNYCKTSMQT